ncbi:hypothetical protein SAMN04488548_1341831 [Gordonia westfalica]|uniref:Integrase core domain-containing protein n=1 Tax=Gordonia westfalica TaxID=158898 RepID=A0A1H2J8T2_9ACTN|nr:hypothetical protein SAMN04488548_1341831 [Gordonia westfalica]
MEYQRLLTDNGPAFNPSRRGRIGQLVEHAQALGVETITGKPCTISLDAVTYMVDMWTTPSTASSSPPTTKRSSSPPPTEKCSSNTPDPLLESATSATDNPAAHVSASPDRHRSPDTRSVTDVPMHHTRVMKTQPP